MHISSSTALLPLRGAVSRNVEPVAPVRASSATGDRAGHGPSQAAVPMRRSAGRVVQGEVLHGAGVPRARSAHPAIQAYMDIATRDQQERIVQLLGIDVYA